MTEPDRIEPINKGFKAVREEDGHAHESTQITGGVRDAAKGIISPDAAGNRIAELKCLLFPHFGEDLKTIPTGEEARKAALRVLADVQSRLMNLPREDSLELRTATTRLSREIRKPAPVVTPALVAEKKSAPGIDVKSEENVRDLLRNLGKLLKASSSDNEKSERLKRLRETAFSVFRIEIIERRLILGSQIAVATLDTGFLAGLPEASIDQLAISVDEVSKMNSEKRAIEHQKWKIQNNLLDQAAYDFVRLHEMQVGQTRKFNPKQLVGVSTAAPSEVRDEAGVRRLGRLLDQIQADLSLLQGLATKDVRPQLTIFSERLVVLRPSDDVQEAKPDLSDAYSRAQTVETELQAFLTGLSERIEEPSPLVELQIFETLLLQIQAELEERKESAERVSKEERRPELILEPGATAIAQAAAVIEVLNPYDEALQKIMLSFRSLQTRTKKGIDERTLLLFRLAVQWLRPHIMELLGVQKGLDLKSQALAGFLARNREILSGKVRTLRDEKNRLKVSYEQQGEELKGLRSERERHREMILQTVAEAAEAYIEYYLPECKRKLDLWKKGMVPGKTSTADQVETIDREIATTEELLKITVARYEHYRLLPDEEKPPAADELYNFINTVLRLHCEMVERRTQRDTQRFKLEPRNDEERLQELRDNFLKSSEAFFALLQRRAPDLIGEKEKEITDARGQLEKAQAQEAPEGEVEVLRERIRVLEMEKAELEAQLTRLGTGESRAGIREAQESNAPTLFDAADKILDEDERKKLESQIEGLEKARADAVAATEAANTTAQEERSKIGGLEARVKSLQSELSEVQKQANTLKRQLAAQKGVATRATNARKDLKDQLNGLKKELGLENKEREKSEQEKEDAIAERESALVELQLEREAHERTQHELEGLRDEHFGEETGEEKAAELDSMRTELDAMYEQDFREIQGVIAAKTKVLERVQKELESKRSELRGIEEQLGQARAEISKKDRQISESGSTNMEQLRAAEGARQETDNLRAAYQEAEKLLQGEIAAIGVTLGGEDMLKELKDHSSRARDAMRAAERGTRLALNSLKTAQEPELEEWVRETITRESAIGNEKRANALEKAWEKLQTEFFAVARDAAENDAPPLLERGKREEELQRAGTEAYQKLEASCTAHIEGLDVSHPIVREMLAYRARAAAVVSHFQGERERDAETIDYLRGLLKKGTQEKFEDQVASRAATLKANQAEHTVDVLTAILAAALRDPVAFGNITPEDWRKFVTAIGRNPDTFRDE
jgi:hypothetical protein